MFNKILVANRGEIAVRIIRCCRELGIKTVAVYAEEDREALHTQLADEVVCVGKGDVRNSYLNIPNIISAARITGAEAVHPGYGFLSENASFAKTLEDCGIVFIGPKADIIDRMGDKSNARQAMMQANVPVVPGSKEEIETFEEGIEIAREIGFPVLIKASSGGGGRGMRIANTKEEFKDAYHAAKSEAEIAFGNGGVYVEKFITNPRHIEVQILADAYGNVIHLGERDCSLQRRNQKVLEEAPAACLSDEQRSALHEVSVKAAASVRYQSAGTLEFIFDGENFYFIEMNTRVQVEHPVSEIVSSIDIIAWQIRIAAGERLSVKQEDICIRGHAIECRINAENPKLNFMPSPGTIDTLHLPGGYGVRIDGAIYQGVVIPSRFDSLLAKVIVHGKDRQEAIKRMQRALAEFIVEGVDTNIEFQLKLVTNPDFIKNNIHTGWIGEQNWSE
ncbi:acetyl-CoA carboxylase biotin carboxylase subunit [Clostridia bacterium]|nr:acetyl-CoA carboxylase biotin carboxylase subunit [Clostridia bacterium]